MELYLGLGSNEGCREEYIQTAIVALENAFDTACRAVSSVVETEPWGFESSRKFLNAVIVLDVDLDHFCSEYAPSGEETDISGIAELILRICKNVERMCGRKRCAIYDENGNRIYHDRPMDVDILFMGTHRIETDNLTIPHKDMKERDFVMQPLKEIVSDEIVCTFPEIFELN